MRDAVDDALLALIEGRQQKQPVQDFIVQALKQPPKFRQPTEDELLNKKGNPMPTGRGKRG